MPELSELGEIGTVYRCSECHHKCFFQVQMVKVSFVNSPRKYKDQKKLVKLDKEVSCNRSRFDNMYPVEKVEELLEL